MTNELFNIKMFFDCQKDVFIHQSDNRRTQTALMYVLVTKMLFLAIRSTVLFKLDESISNLRVVG